jgi:uncharacterized protein DUF2703
MDLQIDFLFLDLETCTRCRGTNRNLEAALEATRELLAATGTRGEEHTEPPVAMITDAILREVYRDPAVEREPDLEANDLPENLERFFAGKKAAEAGPPTAAQEPAQAGCCPPSEQRSCCDPKDKAECCGTSSGNGCGCR